MSDELRIVFTNFPGPGNECVFVECETPDGKSINAGEWRRREDGLVELRLAANSPLLAQKNQRIAELEAELAAKDRRIAEIEELLQSFAKEADTYDEPNEFDGSSWPDHPMFKVGHLRKA